MLELVEITPIQLSDSDVDWLKMACKKHFKDHEFRYETDGYIMLTKESWANPESFSMHWYEFVLTVLIDYLSSSSNYYRKSFFKSCVTPRFKYQQAQHPITYLRLRHPNG